MANVKISELTAASTLAATDQFEINAAGTSKSATAQKIADFLASVSQTLTQKTFDTAGSGNSFKINGTAISAVTGTGSVVLSTSPTLTTPNIGTATGTGLKLNGNPPTAGQLSVVGPTGGVAFASTDNVNNSLYIVHSSGGAQIATDSGGALRLATNGTTTAITINSAQRVTFSGAINYGGVTLDSSVTGTGSMVLSDSPTVTTKATINGVQYGAYTTGASVGGDGSNMAFRTYASGGIYFQSSSGTTWSDVNSTRFSFSIPINYGGVTLSNSVTGTGSMVLSASPTLTSFSMLQANAGAFGAGEWSRNAGWGTYYYSPATGSNADIALFDNTQRNGWYAGSFGVVLTYDNGSVRTTGLLVAATTGAVSTPKGITSNSGTAVGAGASTQAWIKASSTADLGVYYGTGAPGFSAAKGSLYSRTDATTTTTRLYVNTDGSTTWANFTASA